MSAIDTPHSHHFPSHKRKLDDFNSDSDSLPGDDFSPAVFPFSLHRKSPLPSSKGKSLFHDHLHSPLPNYLPGESSRQSLSSDFPTRLHLQFFVKLISGGKTLVLQANLTDTVQMIHQKIHSITGIPLIEQRLIYRGKQLQWEQTLQDCNLQNDAGLQLVGRMRSTDHPRAWRVINDMVSVVCRICRNDITNLSSASIKGKLEQYMALPLRNLGSLMFRKDWKKCNNKKKQWMDADDEDDDEGEGEGEGEVGSIDNINKVDYCKIFMDACAPQALVMLYVSSDKRNQDCANDCIRCFVGFLKDLDGGSIERAYCATIVLEFCRLLSAAAPPDNLLFFHCRGSLGSMLEKIELGSGPRESYATSNEDTTCLTIHDVFPFLKDLAHRLVKDLVTSLDSDTNLGPSPRDVIDFAAFLQPVLGYIQKRHAIMAAIHQSKGRVDPIGEEVDNLFHLFNELFTCIHKCLLKVDNCLDANNKKDGELNYCGWSEYLPILKELCSISVLYPGSEDRFWGMIIQYKVAIRGLIVKYAKRPDDYSWLFKHKDVLDFESRRHLAMLMFPEVREDYEEVHEMLIDRSKLLAESFEYISRAQPSSLHAGLFMEFKNEEATGPGVLREWFCLVCQAIFDPHNALFVACPLDRRRFFPNPASKIDPLHLQYFRFSGRVIALALMHKIQVGVVLDRIFFLQLSGRHVSMEDIRDADPCIYNSCKQILEMDAEFVDSDGLGLTFVTEIEELGSRKVVELCPGGKEITVNSKNRKGYVNLIVQHHFVTSIAEQVSSFATGFSDILRDIKLREIFFESLEPEDLDWMLYGSGNEICIQDWKSHTEYNGYKKSDPQIVWFWEVLEQLSGEQKKTLLFFWTSVKYLPVEGFSGLASRLFIYKSLECEERLPSSHTCFYRLCIPTYPSKEVMQERILVITQEHVGCSFGTW